MISTTSTILTLLLVNCTHRRGDKQTGKQQTHRHTDRVGGREGEGGGETEWNNLLQAKFTQIIKTEERT